MIATPRPPSGLNQRRTQAPRLGPFQLQRDSLAVDGKRDPDAAPVAFCEQTPLRTSIDPRHRTFHDHHNSFLRKQLKTPEFGAGNEILTADGLTGQYRAR